MKHSLQLRLSQHLTLTPQLQQSIRLLQLSTIELNQELERVLQENPLLEREDGAGDQSAPPPDTATTTTTRDEAPATDAAGSDAESREPDRTELGAFDDMTGSGYREDAEDGDYPQQPADAPTLRAHLLAQLSLINVSERDRKLVTLLIDSLDDDGYLTQSLDELLEMLPPEVEAEPEELQIALKHLQHLEPVGVGARNLSECLALQVGSLPPDTAYRAEAMELVKHHLEALAARDFSKLKKLLRCDDVVLRGVQKLITSLNPRPGRDYSSDETRFIVPDVIVKKVKGVWVASLNPDAMPRLRINRLYADILQRNRNAGSQQLATHLQEAKWLIKNVQQRFETILRVSQAIVDRQRNFFEHGEVAMRPLVLREIAEGLELHESTVSRVTTQKFMHTPRGIFELKYFFGSHVTTDAGGSASSTAIRALIKQLVAAENGRKPLSDGQISEILAQQGLVVARRTVAKYRESLQILPVNLRKTI
ncbi:MAG: RNA polymerase sigma-54 factor [Betaproteobacteria bacterium SG8_41]|nr:MAG: RNA polymerase sigma-54 factor [Betaproteobacteria bacterium SG8_41]